MTAIDMRRYIAPKSDQLNADDLIGGPRTITVTQVRAHPDSAEQPISVSFQGDGGKPYKPCKSMRRVMVQIWGADASQYAGRSMTLYLDPDVKFGGMKVGGIRIWAMTGLERQTTLSLTATRAQRTPFIVRPLDDIVAEPAAEATIRNLDEAEKALNGAGDMPKLVAAWKRVYRMQWSKDDLSYLEGVKDSRKLILENTAQDDAA